MTVELGPRCLVRLRRVTVGMMLAAATAAPPAAAGQVASIGGARALSAGHAAALPAGHATAVPAGHAAALPAGRAAVASIGGAPAVSARTGQAGNEIDRFMERVLENRDASWRRIGDFVLREVLTLDVDGPAGLPITGFRHEYEWYVREDAVVRSPRRFDGVDIGEAERREYEEEWLRRQRERREAERREEGRRAADEAAAAAENAAASESAATADSRAAHDEPAAPDDAGPVPGQREAEVADPERLEPEFITDAGYFLEFPFEPGNYYLAGYETLAGREVVKIEYYPTDLFEDDSEPESERERRIAEGFAKTSLVTLWIDPEVHEVVRYTFENVGLDFLPGRWLVRVDGWHAMIEMAQPIGGVWLPSRMILTGGATTALGAFEMRLTREYSDYREALTSGRVVGVGDVTGDRR